MAKSKRPPVAINPSIPLEIQRELRKVASFAFDAQDRSDKALEGLKGKVGKNAQDLMEVSSFVSNQVQAGGKYPIKLTSLVGSVPSSTIADEGKILTAGGVRQPTWQAANTTGITATISYRKSDGVTNGTLNFTNGLLTGSS
jgi:hypothetical protein